MDEKLFSVSEFAKFSRVTRAMLLHYDKIGLLSPELREANGYRFYSTRQLATINLIRTAQDLGLSLDEIKQLRDQRTPDRVNALMVRLMKRTDDKISELLRARKLLWTLQDSILSVLNADEDSITVQSLPAEAIILGDQNNYGAGESDFDALFRFYHSIQNKYPNLDLNYPVWALFSEERIKRKSWIWPDRYYFYNPAGRDQRPAARYVVGYARGGYGRSGGLYERLISYIDGNGLEICGDAYEEYPLNEMCIADDSRYLKRVLITVREKSGAAEK